MQNILVIGAGRIGSLIATLLADSGDYLVTLIDINFSEFEKSGLGDALPRLTTHTLDISDVDATRRFLEKSSFRAVISCLPYFRNSFVADMAKSSGMHYFDLTEDVEVTQKVTALGSCTK